MIMLDCEQRYIGGVRTGRAGSDGDSPAADGEL